MAIVPSVIPASQNPQTEIPAEGVGNPIVDEKSIKTKKRKKKNLTQRLVTARSQRVTYYMNKLTDKTLKDKKQKRELARKLAIANKKLKSAIQLNNEGLSYCEAYYKLFTEVEKL